MKRETAAVHVGVDKDPCYGSVTTPIYQTSNFRFEEIGRPGEYKYTRVGNPTQRALEENLAALEGGTFARVTGSGMSGIAAALLILQAGDHVILPRDVYGGTYRLADGFLTRLGLSFTFVDMQDLDEIRRALRPQTALIWLETPSNPLLKVTDIGAVVALAADHGALTAADNTFMTPYLQRPLALGVDLVVHSSTKYLNGHSDVVGGAVVTADAGLAERLAGVIGAFGFAEPPFDAWLVLRGVKTLAPRMQAHERNTREIAEFLTGHPHVLRVYYPGLPSDPGHELALRQQSGFGGMVSFELDVDAVEPRVFFSRLSLFAVAGSLGGVESLAGYPWTMSHSTMPEQARREAGITPGTVRLSVGIEHPADLIADLERALG